MEFPNNCIRGVVNDSYIRNNIIGPDLFYFKDRDSHENGWTDLSVNWQDDELTIESGIDGNKLLLKKWAVRDVERPESN